jgi:hypothetical protein
MRGIRCNCNEIFNGGLPNQLKSHPTTGFEEMTIARSALVLLTGACFIAGCYTKSSTPQATTPQTKVAPPTPIAQQKEQLGKPSWDPGWDSIVETSLPPEMLTARVAHDVKPFCPRFLAMSEVDKRAFWAYFFQALAAVEAGLTPTEDVRHTEPQVAVKDRVTKRMVRSEGLLQLAYMDADRYGCDFDWERDKQLPEKDPARTILQPKNNLTCGIKILQTQLLVKSKPLISSASYWSTLQPHNASYKSFIKQMANEPQPCKVSPSNEADRRAQSTVPSSVATAAHATGTK